MPSRPCGPRKSKSNPTAYSRDELIDLAKAKKIRGYSKMKVAELCAALFKKKASKTPKKPSKTPRKRSPSGRPCGPRKGKAYPNAYNRQELVELAQARGLLGISKMNIADLCRALFGRSPPRKAAPKFNIFSDRPCGPRKSKAYPNAYNKKELVDLAKEKGIPGASKLTLDELCQVLFGQRIPTPPPAAPVFEEEEKIPLIYDRPCVKRSKKSLREYQQVAIQSFVERRGIIVAYGMGTGKTLLAVAAAECAMDENPNLSVIVSTPASVVDNFKNAIKQYGSSQLKYNVVSHGEIFSKYTSVNGDMKELAKIFTNKILIIDEAHNLRGLDTFDDMEEEEKKDFKKPPEKGETLLLRATEIVDVPKKMRKVARCFVDICKIPNKVLLLSGTPIVNTPLDLIPMIAMVDGQEPISHRYFKQEIYNMEENEPGPQFKDYFGGKIVYCFPDKARDQNYPKRVDIPVLIPMDEKFRKSYEDLVNAVAGGVPQNLFQTLKEYKLDPTKKLKTFMNGLRRGINNIKDLDGKIPKLEEAVKICRTGKTIIYSGWLEAGINVLKKRLTEEGLSYREISGQTPMKKREEVKNEFNSDKADVLLITKAGGEGLDLKGVRNVIIYEPLWNNAMLEQVVARAIRFRSHVDLPPEERYVNVYYLRMRWDPEEDEDEDPSMDSHIFVIAERKKRKNDIFWAHLAKVTIKGC